MSIYCIGDLHGRYDLFQMALKKIDFNVKIDKMYILGDIIDVNYGSIDILRHIMQYPDSFEFILGNHEENFKFKETAYDMFMMDENLKEIVQNVVDNYLKEYRSISEVVKRKIEEKDIQSIKDNSEIKKWLKPSKKRVLLLDAMINLIEYLDYDENKIWDMNNLFHDMIGAFKTKQFVKELLNLNTNEYMLIKEYVFSRTKEIKFTYLGKEFWLTHALPIYTRGWFLRHIPDMTTRNQYVIFGHEPVPQIHRSIISRYFEFNYREVFSYIDRFNNRYYDLDMGDNVIAILRLDDFEEFYVMKYKKEPKGDLLKSPIEPVYERKVGYKIVESTLHVNKRPKGFSFITYKDYCIEFLVGVNKLKKEIYYSRISYLYAHPFYSTKMNVINDWYNNQSIECIIEKVIDDDNSKKDTEYVAYWERYIRDIK